MSAKNVTPGVPTCGRCLDAMKCVKNGAVVLCGCKEDERRLAYAADVYECRHCGARVVDIRAGQTRYEIPAANLAHLRSCLGEWVLEAGYSVEEQ